MKQIFDLHAFTGIENAKGYVIDAMPHRLLRDCITFHEPGAGLPGRRQAAVPDAEAREDPDRWPEYWSVSSTSLTEFADIRCRNVDVDYRDFLAMERIRYGLAPTKGSDTVDPHVEVRLQLGEVESDVTEPLKLPLEARHHFQTWTVRRGRMVEGEHTSWRLGGELDFAIVHVFVYDVDDTGKVVPFSPTDYEEIADQKLLLDLCRRFAPSVPVGAIHDDESPISQGFYKDGLFRHRGDVATAQVGEETGVRVVPTRILVALTLTCFKQTGDFQPAPSFVAISGAARFWPVIQVAATRPIVGLRGSVQLDRPDKSEWASGAGSHCEELHGTTMKSMLVVDSNSGARTSQGPIGQLAPMPHWSALFNYYVTQVWHELASEVLHVIKRVAPERKEKGLVTRLWPNHEEWLPNPWLTKCARQGEFDNIHMAPGMSIDATWAYLPDEDEYIDLSDRKRFRLDDISMAPFCAHDCLHVHWRWTDIGAFLPHSGFSRNQANVAAGLPMVPAAQDVFLWFRGLAKFTYHAEHYEPEATRVGVWVPIFHHGAAYLTSSETVSILAARATVGVSMPVWFLRSKDKRDGVGGPVKSWAVFYWALRFYMKKDASGAWYAAERVTPNDAFGLRAARSY
jgi:hypothetical protein